MLNYKIKFNTFAKDSQSCKLKIAIISSVRLGNCKK